MRKETKTSYWSNGNKRCKATYVNDKIHGLIIRWHYSGEKYCETPYKNDLQHGSKIYFIY